MGGGDRQTAAAGYLLLLLLGCLRVLWHRRKACTTTPRPLFSQPIYQQLVEEDEGMKQMSAELAHIKQAANMQVSVVCGGGLLPRLVRTACRLQVWWPDACYSCSDIELAASQIAWPPF